MSVSVDWNKMMKDDDGASDNSDNNQSPSKKNSNIRKRTKSCVSDEENTATGSSSAIKRKYEVETNPDVLRRRQKQIDYGKNTVGYWSYLKKVPINLRSKDDPKTPDKFMKYSRRSWDTLIQMWRLRLHKYDPDPNSGNEDTDNDSAKS